MFLDGYLQSQDRSLEVAICHQDAQSIAHADLPDRGHYLACGLLLDDRITTKKHRTRVETDKSGLHALDLHTVNQQALPHLTRQGQAQIVDLLAPAANLRLRRDPHEQTAGLS